jgi:hypothetical protein
MQPVPADDAGPTLERLKQSGGFFTDVGRTKSSRRVTMQDDALGRAWMRQKISGEEYAALKRYALHWLAGGLLGPLQSVDLNRIFAFDPGAMSGLAKSERQQDHRSLYWAAHDEIGTRPALVADAVACAGCSLEQTGHMLGYRSPWHARDEARKILSDAGYRLSQFWKDRDR